MSRLTAAGRLACAAVLLVTAPAARAANNPPPAAVYLKDGHVLKGYVVQPSETIVDPISQQPITLHKGIFLVDDLCRRFFFSHAYVDHAETRPFDPGKYFLDKRSTSFPEAKSLPPIRELLKVGEWSDKADREYVFRNPLGEEVKLSQHASLLAPHFIRVDANCIDPVTKKNNPYPATWYYRTREFGPDTVVTLLSLHKDLADTPGLTEEQRADRRFQIFNFLVQVGWMDAAEKELDRIRRDFPKQKEKVDTAAEGIKKLVAQDRWDEIKLAHNAGRHQAAQNMLATFPMDKADDQTQTEVRALKNRYDTAGTSLKRARELLAGLAKDVTAAGDKALFLEAATVISDELNLDHFFRKADNEEGRLERFLSQAEQAQRFAKLNQTHLKPEELLSLAVTGWLLGNASAETKPESARRLWEARRFVRQYQKTTDGAKRATLLTDLESKSKLGIAEIAQLIGNLPPIDPPEKVTSAEVEMTTGGGAGKGTTYHLKMPPEYHLGRPYPVLIALHHGGETGKDMVKRWGDQAARYGYILACPDWDQKGGVYAYSPEEHATVLDTLRDLRQHFNVDSDRVFLTGYGEGGNMAWDVGLSHADLFAGVVPISGYPRKQGKTYWTNALELPFYVVWGERMGGYTANKKDNGNLETYNIFNEFWIPGGFPVVGVQYKGRGLEWFSAEVPDAFDWMAQKRRHHPMKVGWKDVPGKNGEVSEVRKDQRTSRAQDNSFYWVRLDEIAPAYLARGKEALVCAKIVNGNQIGVNTEGIRQVSLWLERGMIDFDKPVTVKLNFGSIPKLNGVMIKPSLTTLLEDFFERGDRQRLFLARIELKG
jgi:pimeloyl-ACP methyl ester carboxylesterase